MQEKICKDLQVSQKKRYNVVPVYTGDRDDVYMEEDNSTQHEEDSVVLTGVKKKQDHGVEAKSAFPVLRLVPPVTNK